MEQKVFMAIGGHIGDAELTSGCLLATLALQGNKIVTVALTAGERGAPKGVDVNTYRLQKIKEATEFATLLKGEAIVFDYLDGELPDNEEVRFLVADLIRKYKPSAIFTHFKNSMHKDHENTYKIVKDAAFYSAIDMGDKLKGERHWAPLYLAENWEDRIGFEPYIYFDTTLGYDLWCEGLKKHWFIMNSKDFKYYDYYTHLSYVRGALNKTLHAECFAVEDYQKFIRHQGL